MGSYLSVVNDTNEVWSCNVGPDEAAAQISGFVLMALGGIAAACASGPFGALTNAAQIAGCFSVRASQIARIASTATSIAPYVGTAKGAAGLALAATKNLIDNSNKRPVKPGHKERWGKMSLSLWQQAECVSFRESIENGDHYLTTRVVYMRPIFSGATDNSEHEHRISFWIDKHGVEEQKTLIKITDD